jgi:membrane dipeptidase
MFALILAALALTARAEVIDAWRGPNATALRAHALDLMAQYPLVDTHVDVPQILRTIERRPMDGIDKFRSGMPGHVDIGKIKAGKVGGMFLTVWTPCPKFMGQDEGPDYLNPLTVSHDQAVHCGRMRKLMADCPRQCRNV